MCIYCDLESRTQLAASRTNTFYNMAGATTDNRTILDYLNEDCWKAVLDNVPVKDIIRTERASHRWQNVVLVYLRRVRISIDRYGSSLENDDDEDDVLDHKVSRLTLKDDGRHSSAFQAWTNKLGPSVVSTYCASEESLKVIGENCPNLEALVLIRLSDQLLLNIPNEIFKWLRKLHFKGCILVSDHSVSRFITENTLLEQLEINYNEKVTGKCLANIKSAALKSLVFNECKALEFNHLLSAVDQLSALTKLVLVYVPPDVYKQIHLVLDKLPNLEHLRIFHFDVKTCDNFFEYVCRLRNLKRLYANINATDVNLEDVTRCCKELRSLELGKCETVTARGLEAVRCNAGPRLTSLGVPHSEHLTDDDVIACINECPNLTYLDVGGCMELTEELLPRAAVARRRMRARSALRLSLAYTDLEASDYLGEYDELTWTF